MPGAPWNDFDGTDPPPDIPPPETDPPPDTLPDTLPATLSAAIQRRAESTPGLEDVEGGVEFGVVTDNPGRRYIAFFQLPGTIIYTTGPSYHERIEFQFDCWAPTSYEATQMAEWLQRAFYPGMPDPLEWSEGTVAHAQAGTPFDGPREDIADDASRIVRSIIRILFITNRTK